MMFETETTQWYPISVDSKEGSSRILAQNRVSQVFWDPIKNRVSPRSVLLKAVYLEALLYSNLIFDSLLSQLSLAK